MTDLLGTIATESARFLEVVTTVPPEAPVPSCPDWTADDLLRHLTQVHTFWAMILREEVVDDDDADRLEALSQQQPDDQAAVIAQFEAETRSLIDQLAARPDTQPAWSWFPPNQTVGFTRRMQAHEATMHRVDAELAAGVASAPIDPELAADGFAHGIEVMLSWLGVQPGFRFEPRQELVEVVFTDLGRSRFVQPGRWIGVGQSGKHYDEPALRFEEGGVASASFVGTAEQLERWLWGRGPEPATTGDAASLAAFREAVAQGMQ